MRIRKVKNSSGNTSVQVGYYEGKRFRLVKHIGSASNQERLQDLLSEADRFIHKDYRPLFSLEPEISSLQPIGYSYSSTYKYFDKCYREVFSNYQESLLKDLAIIRLIKPTSKLESINFIKDYFGIHYSKTTVHRKIKNFNKDKVVRDLISYAKENLSFDFSFVFYDVTTLYFDTSNKDEIRKTVFSKDGKHNKPQILIGLVVDRNGFPIYYDLFKGNTFKGHTMIPVILNFKKRFNISNLTIIADAAMLSKTNLETLESEGFSYIVGARKNAIKTPDLLKELKLHDDNTKVVKDTDGRYMVYNYSYKRERKDLYEIEKLLEKAQYIKRNPNKNNRNKFLSVKGSKMEINDDLVEKHRMLAGIKVYKTNINLEGRLVVERYKDLWQVERAFRITKSDLKARPIYHRKEEAIQSHILIVFTSLALAKHIEFKEDKSIQTVIKEKMRKITVTFRDHRKQLLTFDLLPH